MAATKKRARASSKATVKRPARRRDRARAGVRETKAHLSELLRRVKAGETITITEHGRAIAKLSPAEEEDDLDPGTRALVEAGHVKLPLKKLEPFGRPIRLPPGVDLQKQLREDRDSRG